MHNNLPAITPENEQLSSELEQLRLEFLDLFTRHKDMVENESLILTSLYLEKLGHLQLELLQKQTEASRLKMKMKLIQAAFNRNEQPDLEAIDLIIAKRLNAYYASIEAQSIALDDAMKVLSHLLSEEDTRKLKETFRVLCKRLHPDLNPNQTEAEKDLFIKVKAAYDLQQISELQKILLFLDESVNENIQHLPGNEKKDRIAHLRKNIEALNDKIERLKQSFPFTVEALINDQEVIARMQDKLREQIRIAEEEINKYSNIINLMTDE